MKLDYDCLRLILLTIEKDLVWDEELKRCQLNLDHMVQEIPKFTKSNIAYTSKIAIEANLIKGRLSEYENRITDISYFGLSYEGHQFLDTVRENKVWKKNKGNYFHRWRCFTVCYHLCSKRLSCKLY